MCGTAPAILQGANAWKLSVLHGTVPSGFVPILYKRYIDDTFVSFNDKAHVQLFINYLNSQHTSINFTMELENNNNHLPFLDCLVTRDSNQFCT